MWPEVVLVGHTELPFIVPLKLPLHGAEHIVDPLKKA